MTVRLQLRDGTVKEYPSGQGESGQLMKCGASDCEHLECAIDERIARSRMMKTLSSLVPVGTIIALGVLFFVVMDSSILLISLALAAAIVLGDIAVIIIFRNISRALDRQAGELREFSEKKTVNGIPAQQIHETASRE